MAGTGCSIPRIRASASVAFRQRVAVCLGWSGWAVAALGQGDQGGRLAGAHCAWQAPTEWSVGTFAPDLAAGHCQPSNALAAPAARAPARLSRGLQRGTSPPGAGQSDAGHALRGLAATLRRCPARAEL